ncbi:response regulator transcription factor [Streptomycetaceae bacterium NBC_01309]
MITVLLVDDHPVFRYGLTAVLSSDPGLELAGTAATGEEAVAQARELRPDVVLMDLTMPGVGGIEATSRILAELPETRVLVVTMYEDSSSVLAAVRAGACGYLVKGADRDEVLRAIRSAAAGTAVFSAAAARHVAEHLTAPRRPADPVSPVFPALTAREHEILDLMASGMGNAGIAQRYTLSQKTVRNYVSAIITKLGATDRAAAISLARTHGMG